MKKIIILFSLIFVTMVHAQVRIAVVKGSNTIICKDLPNALSLAETGASIYLPGGTFSGSFTISKKLHIYGAGHYPDSTQTTGITYIIGDITLTAGSDSSIIEGLNLNSTGNILFSGDSVGNITIRRNNFSNFTETTTWTKYASIYQNVINGNITLHFLSYNTMISNNIICGIITGLKENDLVQNNALIFSQNWNYTLSCNNVLIQNNVIYDNGNYPAINGVNNMINNNIITQPWWTISGNFGSGNFIGIPQGQMFINQNSNNFDYTQDYHINVSDTATYKGTDGKQIGIYGGIYPWKEGAVPSNPHIQYKDIDNQTDGSGNLKVNIQVAAQDN